MARIVTDLYGKVNEETLVLSRPQLSHRFQTVRDDRAVAGLRWVNDSAATAPESTLRGLEEVGRDSVLILGGRNKGFDLDSLTRSVAGRCVAVATLGETGSELAGLLAVHGGKVRSHRTLAKAVRWSGKVCPPGGTVLLSPGMASTDMFTDYRQRGNEFCRLVEG